MSKADELKQEIVDWWRTKFRVELKDDICQKLTIDEVEELCNKIVEPRKTQIAELEKENAELKNIERMAIYTKLSDQLAQAKELIKSLIEEVTSYEEINDYDKCEAVVEAEQFLKKVK
jgi:hypothetical protein